MPFNKKTTTTKKQNKTKQKLYFLHNTDSPQIQNATKMKKKTFQLKDIETVILFIDKYYINNILICSIH